MKLAIITACSQDWVPMASATLLSCARNRTIAAKNFIIAPQGTTANCIQLIETASALAGEPISVIEFDRQIISGLNYGIFHEANVYRLMMDKLIDHDFDRVLYLDSDLLVVGSIDALLNCDLQDNLVAAVADCGMLPGFLSGETTKRRTAIGFNADQKYFNSGVMLFSWSQALAENIFREARDLLAKHNFDLADQDALNVVLKNRWREIHPKYNVLSPGRNIIEPLIAHFTHRPKPWESECAKKDLVYRDLYKSLFIELKVEQMSGSGGPRRGATPKMNVLTAALKKLELVFRPDRRRKIRERKETQDRLDRELAKAIHDYTQAYPVYSNSMPENTKA